MSLPQDEARQRILQSQRLLGEGKGYLAKLAADIAVTLDPGSSTNGNRDTIRATMASWNDHTRPRCQPFQFREALELHRRRASLAFRTLVQYIPEAYRTRVAASMIILGLAIIARYIYGGALPLKWLLTGAYYQKNFENGSFTFLMSPSIGWLLLSVIFRFFLQRPAPQRRAHAD